MGLHPHHLDEYSLRELMNRLRGYQTAKKEDWAVLRRIGFINTRVHLDKNSTFKPDDIFPLGPEEKKEVKYAKIEKIG